MLKATLEQWRMFKAVVDHGGFNQASKQIHKSQSSIHHSVQKLEETLGIPLLQVAGRKTLLTEAGELMLRRANYLLDEAAKIEALAGSISEGIETHLRIAVDEAFPQRELFRVIEAVSAQYPLLRVELIETVLSGANERVSSGDADLGISPVADDSAFSEEICQLQFVAVASPHFSLNQIEGPLSLETVKSCRQIVVRDSAQARNLDSGWLGAEQRWTVSNLNTSIEMVSQGFGFAWLPAPSIAGHIERGLLLPLNLKQGSTRKISQFLHFADGDRLGPAARSFIGELRYQTRHFETSEDD